MLCARREIDLERLKFAVYDFTSMYTKFTHDTIMSQMTDRKIHARTLFAMLSQRYIDDGLHVLTDPEAFNSDSALYDDRTATDGSQDGGNLDGIYPRTSIGPDGNEIDMPFELECVHAP